MKNEPAFPVTSAAEHEYCGMTLRDYFAAKAITAICCDYQSKISLMVHAGKSGISFAEEIAMQAYDMADAMLAAREAE